MRQVIDRISFFILRLSLPATIFLVPLFFLPITTDFFNPNKQLLLVSIASLALLAFAIRSVAERQIRISLSPALLPLLALTIVYLLSSTVRELNPLLPLTSHTSTIIAITIIFITTTSTLTLTSHLALILSALILSLTIASLFTIYQFTGVSRALTDIVWLQNKSFNPLGGPLPFLTLSLPTLITSAYLGLRIKNSLGKLLLFLSTTIITIASILTITLLLPVDGQPNLILLPYNAGWVIAVEIFKTFKTGLIGTGPASFANVYPQLKPGFINTTPFWNLRFSNSSNEYFHLLTTVGLLGLATYLLATIKTSLRAFREKKPTPYLTASRNLLVMALTLQLFVPASIPLLTLVFVSLALVTIGLKTTQDPIKDARVSLFATEIIQSTEQHSKQKKTEVLPYILLIIVIIVLSPTLFHKAKVYAAEVTFMQSLQAAAQNKGIDTYNLQIKAINLFPQDPKYHISYSQTNLALANALSTRSDLSDQDKNNITQLIGQAIREAKLATTLDPNNPATWANLATIYRQLINVADEADQWTIAAYSEAIKRDPLNPQLRVELGGVYYSLKNYDQAIRIFTSATETKPDWPNAYYNLSASYREAKLYPQALQAMRIVVELLDPTTSDYQKAQDELKQLEALVETNKTGPALGDDQPATESGELALPSPIPTPLPQPIELPDGSGLNIPDQEQPESTKSATTSPNKN